MTLVRLVLVAFSLVTTQMSSAAEQQTVPENVLNEMAKDLDALNDVVVRAGREKPSVASPSYWQYNWAFAITKDKAEVKEAATQDAKKVFDVKRGESFKVVDKAGTWYALQKGGKTLGWVDASTGKPIALEELPPEEKIHPSEGNEGLFRTLTERAAKLRDKYRNNPYVEVMGFSVHLGVPPSLDVSFEFILNPA